MGAVVRIRTASASTLPGPIGGWEEGWRDEEGKRWWDRERKFAWRVIGHKPRPNHVEKKRRKKNAQQREPHFPQDIQTNMNMFSRGD